MSRLKKTISEQVAVSIFPVVGRIKCGMKAQTADGKEYPKSVDYFIADSKYAEQFKAIYGDEPRTIEIAFYSDDEAEVCQNFYELRDSAGKLVARGDGELFSIWSTGKQAYVEKSISEIKGATLESFMRDCIEKLPKCAKSEWKEQLKMRFLIPKFKGVYGIWEFRSSGRMSTNRHIVRTFDAVKSQAGFIKFIPFDLQIAMATSQKPENKSRYPVVQIVPHISNDTMQTLADYGSAFMDIRGLLTDEKVQQIAAKALPDIDRPE